MSVIVTSNMHRVLCIPELLDMVFRFLDDASNASNARVCRQWSEIALDTLWRDVDDLYRLFGLLAPLRKADDQEDGLLLRPDDREDYVRRSISGRRTTLISTIGTRRPFSVFRNLEIGDASRNIADVFVAYLITPLMQSTLYTRVSLMTSPEHEHVWLYFQIYTHWNGMLTCRSA